MRSAYDILAKMEEERKATAQKAETGREAIVQALVDKNIDYVRVEFAGSGDSGSIDNISTDPDNDWANGTETLGETLHDEIEGWAYAYLEGTGIDWYNNDGGQGYILFDLRTVPYKFEASVDVNETISSNAHFTEEVA